MESYILVFYLESRLSENFEKRFLFIYKINNNNYLSDWNIKVNTWNIT